MGSYRSATVGWSDCNPVLLLEFDQVIARKHRKMIEIILVSLALSRVLGSPVFVDLQSEYPANPIEDPQSWAWGQHPDNGLGYKAKDNLEVEVCLANPRYINTAKCNLPLEVCLDNPQYLSSLGCSGNDLPPLPLQTCLTFPELLTFPACSGHSLPREVCMANPSLLTGPSCADALQGYQPTLFQCQDNKEQLCSLDLCEKHEFIVKCNG